MRTIDRLRRDHRLLRSKLDALEAALRMGQEAWFVLRELCFSLSRQLKDHCCREEALIAACQEELSEDWLARISGAHRDGPEQLLSINRLFVDEQGQSLTRIRPSLTALIRDLRGHFNEEEAALFPAMEQVLTKQEVAEAGPQTLRSRFDETATVNGVLEHYPRTRTVFERLFVNIALEGGSCLDEVAWRHGMDSANLLAQLNEEVDSDPSPMERSGLGGHSASDSSQQHTSGSP